jgi:hypothetical protein
MLRKLLMGKNASNIFWLIFLVCASSLSAWWSVENISSYGDFGTIDFIEYWAAYQLFLSGDNLYSPKLLYSLQQNLGLSGPHPIMMWNGPWLLTILTPVLLFDFIISARGWFVLSVIFVVISGYLVWLSISSRRVASLQCMFALILFFPIWNAFLFGQTSLLILLGTSILFYGLVSKNDTLSGISFIFLTIKPHLTYLLAIAVIWWFIKERSYKFFISFGLSFSFLLLMMLIQSPTSLGYWIDAINHTPEGVVRIEDWAVATLVGITRVIIDYLYGVYIALPIILIPGVVGIGMLFFLIFKRPEIIWRDFFPPLLCLSVFTSAYGWTFDHALLVIVQVSGIKIIMESKETLFLRAAFILMLFLIQLLGFILINYYFQEHHEFFGFR